MSTLAWLRRVWRETSGEAEDGFAMLDVVVALAILGLSLALLSGIYSTTLASVTDGRSQLQARLIAQALLQQAPLGHSASSGVSQDGFHWRLRVERHQIGKQKDASSSNLVKVSAEVSWFALGHSKTLVLSTMKLVPAETEL